MGCLLFRRFLSGIGGLGFGFVEEREEKKSYLLPRIEE